jgi:hypothetical protein
VENTVAHPWYFETVEASYETADEGADQLGYMAVSLGDALALLEADIPVVIEDWHGRARLAFDEQMQGILEAGHQLRAVLLAGGESVSAAYESAQCERHLRASLRRAWADDEATGVAPTGGGVVVGAGARAGAG